MSKENENLNELYKDKKCVVCGRKYPDTILNIEGWIHHNNKLRCKDLKFCKKAAKKLRK